MRVINRKTAERTLLKGFQGNILDISFARHACVLLGAVDEKGHLYIHDLKETEQGKIEYPFWQIDGLVQDCSISSVLAMEILRRDGVEMAIFIISIQPMILMNWCLGVMTL